MATGNVVVNVVDVGQGQCTFVEIYNTDFAPKLVQTLLFDCGTDKSSDETGTNLKYIADTVSAMDAPAFDCIFFSHSDNDHISLTAELLRLCSKKPTIKKVIYGGNPDQYTKDGENILNELVKRGYCDEDNIISPKSYYSDYDKEEEKYTRALWTSDDDSVNVFSLVCNVLSARGKWKLDEEVEPRKSAVAKNMVSLVAGLYYGGASYVICGDATKATMAAVGTYMKAAPVFGKNVMTTLPHHGSRTTAGLGAKTAKKASKNAALVINTFSKLLRSMTITVSAYALHNHPSLELMNMFVPTVKGPYLRDKRLKHKNAHYLTANMDMELLLDNSKGTGKRRSRGTELQTQTDTSFETKANTFTTRYFDSTEPRYTYEFGISEVWESPGLEDDAGAINGFASWKYTTSSAGNFVIAGFSNLGADEAFTSVPLAASSASAGDRAQSSVRTLRLRSAPLRRPSYAKPLYRERLKQFS